MCISEPFQEIHSPDQKLKAVVFQRDCGATTGYSTQVSILDADKYLPNKKGNVFIQNGHPEWTAVNVTWNDSRSVTITHSDDYHVYKSESRCWFVKVAYESP
jgi:hypothetical protein